MSGVTGVPTPFIIAYGEYFDDCDAESFLHTRLALDGLRLSESREFFRASVSIVVKIISSMQSQGNGEPPTSDNLLLSPDGDEFKDFDFAPLRRTEPWDAILIEADSHYYGYEGYFQDFAEALKL
jgi:hypothetical protein